MVGKQTNGQKTYRSKSEIIQTLNIIGNSRLPLLGLEPSRSVFKKSLPGFSLGLLRAIFEIFDGPCIHEISGLFTRQQICIQIIYWKKCIIFYLYIRGCFKSPPEHHSIPPFRFATLTSATMIVRSPESVDHPAENPKLGRAPTGRRSHHWEFAPRG
jgi:hypothetical protein